MPHLRLENKTLGNLFASYYHAEGRSFPWRMRGLRPWPVLVAELMLHMTTATKVTETWSLMMRSYRTPASIAKAKRSRLYFLLEPLGLQNQRIAQLKGLGAVITKEFHGRIPLDEEALCTLPGIGKYTARALLWTIGERAKAPVDRNVLRVYRRLTGGSQLGEADVENLFGRMLKSCEDGRSIFLGLLDLSAQLCRPTHPKCPRCPIHHFCVTGRRLVRP
jgi:A/G-specific adenine glycosylase